MTSNIGASEIARNTPLGFATSPTTRPGHLRRHEEPDHGRAQARLPARVHQPHRRRDRLPQAAKDEIKEIVDLLLLRIRESMAERELQLELSDEAKDLLVDKGWDPAMGARPLRRAIQRYIEDPLADFVLRSQVPEGSTVLVEPAPSQDSTEEREVKLSVIEPAPKPTPVGVGAEGGTSCVQAMNAPRANSKE
jgi:ATP-dependent Clp protease ATP-binding subunit ClpC